MRAPKVFTPVNAKALFQRTPYGVNYFDANALGAYFLNTPNLQCRQPVTHPSPVPV